ncbi:hypothetical protein [Streptosporangium sp. KLBMP 9127]|nr:hypothetical protein [Streptosporangium sp. KLBMP 9127]
MRGTGRPGGGVTARLGVVGLVLAALISVAGVWATGSASEADLRVSQPAGVQQLLSGVPEQLSAHGQVRLSLLAGWVAVVSVLVLTLRAGGDGAVPPRIRPRRALASRGPPS